MIFKAALHSLLEASFSLPSDLTFMASLLHHYFMERDTIVIFLEEPRMVFCIPLFVECMTDTFFLLLLL